MFGTTINTQFRKHSTGVNALYIECISIYVQCIFHCKKRQHRNGTYDSAERVFVKLIIFFIDHSQMHLDVVSFGLKNNNNNWVLSYAS